MGSTGAKPGAPTASNLAKAFTPTKPMCAPGTDADKLVVMVDLPKALKSVIDAGMKKIDYNCLRDNAKVVLQVFEDICVQHVINNQIHDKQLSKLLQRNPNWEKDNPDAHRTLAPKSRIAKSSLIGRDPCGDEKLPSRKKMKSTSTEEDDAAAEGSAVGLDDDDNAEEEYSSLQLLLIAFPLAKHDVVELPMPYARITGMGP